jgi:hypothetical protein
MIDTPDLSGSRAILIGAATYQDPGFLSLPAVGNSLSGMQQALTDPDLCGWPPGQVTVLENPTDVRRVVVTLRQLARGTRDVLLIYFVGHGVLLSRGRLCLMLSDTILQEPDITGLDYDWVRGALIDSPARVKIVILDCCYSGRVIEALSPAAGIADCTDTAGTYTLTASDSAAHVVAAEWQASSPTSFTGELLDLLRSGIPGGPERLTLGFIYPRLRDRLQSRNLPPPNQRGTDMATQFPFARNRAGAPNDLPPSAALEEPQAVPSELERPVPRARSVAARLLDAGFTLLIIASCIIALDILIPRSTFLPWPWWTVFALGVLGIAVTLGAVRWNAVAASVLLWGMTWDAVYSLSVIGTSHSYYSTQVTVLSAECTVAAVVSAALCIWIIVLLSKKVRSVNPFLAVFMGCFSVELVLAAIALHAGRVQGGIWNAVGVLILAAALGILLAR